jgi:ubiquitin C-terminal hydrolase
MTTPKDITEYALPPVGLVNIGAICYLNSFLQALLSCEAVINLFGQSTSSNKVAVEFLSLINSMLNSNETAVNPSNVFKEIFATVKSKYPNKNWGKGQEDSGEGLVLFLDTIDNKDLYNLFMYRYIVKIQCMNCSKQISNQIDESCIIEIPLGFTSNIIQQKKDEHPINAYIRQYITTLDDYSCSECKTQNCKRLYQLTYGPKIITIMFNKYYKKIAIDFPQSLKFPKIRGGDLIYNLVAKIDHTGNAHSGHYWANCLRHGPGGKNIYSLDDSTVGPGSFDPTDTTYILMYHIE